MPSMFKNSFDGATAFKRIQDINAELDRIGAIST